MNRAVGGPDGERQLRHDGRRFRLLIGHLDDVFWSADHPGDGRRQFSAAYARYWGLGDDLEALAQTRWIDRVIETDRAAVSAAFAAFDDVAIGDGAAPVQDSIVIEYGLRTPNGELRVVRDRGFAVRDERGVVIQVIGIAEDISTQRRTERALRDSERELRIVTSAMPIGIAHVDRELRYRFVNNANAVQHLGSTPHAVVGRRLVDVVGTATMALLQGRIDQVLAGWTVDFEVELPLPGGTRFVHITMVPEHDERKQVRGFIAVTEDITERKRAQTLLHAREREFKTLAENAPDLIARIDTALRYLYVNRAFEPAFALNREHYAGRPAAELGFPASYIEATTAIFLKVFAGGGEQSTTFCVRIGDELRFYLARAVPEFDDRAQVESVLLIVYDVSERVRVELERDRLLASEQAARELAERATRSRDDFLAIVSHELRSPLNGIQSWAQVLESVLDARSDEPAGLARRAIAGIKVGVEQQVRMIDDLLDATRIITGKLSLSLQPVRLRPVLAAALASVRAKADDKAISISAGIRLDSETVEGDADRLQQIVWNVLSNAIKFTPRGGHVWLDADRDGGQAVIRIRDDGRGIDADFLPQVFERFQRDETGNSRGQDGFGLGLMLVRHLCELHRGTVTASSAGRGQGAEFLITLPLQSGSGDGPASPAPAAAVAALPRLDGIRVLLVDDHAASRDALALLLGHAGADVEVMGSGEQAVQRLARRTAARWPDLLICDIAMPGQDGYETLRQLRSQERIRGLGALPAIALTALVHSDDRIRAHDAGFDMHLSKPVAIEELIVTIAAFVRHRERH